MHGDVYETASLFISRSQILSASGGTPLTGAVLLADMLISVALPSSKLSGCRYRYGSVPGAGLSAGSKSFDSHVCPAPKPIIFDVILHS